MFVSCGPMKDGSSPNTTPGDRDSFGDAEDALDDALRDGDRTGDGMPTNSQQTRALWSWAGKRATSMRDIDELVAKIDGAHLNVVLLLVYHNGTAFFEPSHTRFPDGNDRLPNRSGFSEDGYNDALSYLLAIRDERRLDHDPFNDFQVHAWVYVTQGGRSKKDEGWPRPDDTQPYMLHHLHPEFKIKYGRYYLWEDERYVNHRCSVVHQPRFRAYMAALIAGLVEDYDVDGVHLDYIRAVDVCYNNEPLDYPGTEYDYPGCQEDYKAWARETTGREYTLWQDADGYKTVRDGGSGRVAAWQERAVGMLVKRIHDEVKSARPDVIISVASVRNDTSPEARRQSKDGQVAWEWLDRGWIDAVFPTVYSADPQVVVNVIQRFRDATQNESSRFRIFPGLATHGGPIGNEGDEWSDLIVEQVNALMYGQWEGQPLEPPVVGVALWDDRFLSEAAIAALADGPFQRRVLPFWGQDVTPP
jgi:uncharacterized lipoprotein YddW (UPF0748 family)